MIVNDVSGVVLTIYASVTKYEFVHMVAMVTLVDVYRLSFVNVLHVMKLIV